MPPRPVAAPRPGRRPGPTTTQAEILDAAREAFAQNGFDQTSIRRVATAARVDPSLVMQQFGSKEGLYRAVIEQLPAYLAEHAHELDAPGGTFGERLAGVYFSAWAEPTTRATFLAVLRSAGSNEAAVDVLVTAFAGELLPRVSAEVGRPDARDVLAPIAAQLMGTAMGAYVLRIPLFDGLNTQDLAAQAAPVLDAILDRARVTPEG